MPPPFPVKERGTAVPGSAYGIMGPVRATGTTGPRLVAADDPALAEAVAGAERVLVDVGCGDGRHTVRWAEREPGALVVGVDAETTRLTRRWPGRAAASSPGRCS